MLPTSQLGQRFDLRRDGTPWQGIAGSTSNFPAAFLTIESKIQSSLDYVGTWVIPSRAARQASIELAAECDFYGSINLSPAALMDEGLTFRRLLANILEPSSEAYEHHDSPTMILPALSEEAIS